MASPRRVVGVSSLVLLLASTMAARAALFTVGPGGTHATIQAAIDAAVGTPGGDDIRVARGTYHEHLIVHTLDAADPGRLTISGGWDAGFATQIADPNLTVIDADRLGRAIHVLCDEGEVELSLFTLREGFVDASAPEDITGAGALLGAGSTADGERCRIVLRNSAIIEGLVHKPSGDSRFCACGGGVSMFGGGLVELIDNTIAGNEVRNETTGKAMGGGVFAEYAGRGKLRLLGNLISANVAQAGDDHAHSAGAYLSLLGFAEAELYDNTFIANRATDSFPFPSIASVPSALTLEASGSCDGCRIEARRTRVLQNLGAAAQLRAEGQGVSQVLVSDTLVAGGDQDGVQLAVHLGAVRANNLTVTDHAGSGLVAHRSDPAAGEISIANSILFDNGDPDVIHPGVVLDANLTTDPLFLDPARGDYHVRLDSPAVNAGDDAPAGGLGPLDLDREERRQGPAVDIGAYEADEPSGGGAGDDDGLCRMSDDSVIPFVADWLPVCRCLRDDVLRALRCGGLGPGLFMEIMVPLPLVAGQPTEAAWTLHPWAAAAQGDYLLGAALLVGQKTELLLPKGKGSGKLAGKDVRETLRFTTPFAPATLRTTLHLVVPGANTSHEFEMDVLLEPTPPQDPI